MSDKPAGFEHCLGEYGPQLFDGHCGEPLAWGFQIIRWLPEEQFNALGKFGRLECSYPNWYLITKRLTEQEAIDKYGEETDRELGPLGGFKSVTFGNKTFCTKTFNPASREYLSGRT